MNFCQLRIDRSVIRKNFLKITSSLSSSTAVMPIIKANAYGHGAVMVARELKAFQPAYFGVANVSEAIALRYAGIDTPILVLSPPVHASAAAYSQYALSAVVESEAGVAALSSISSVRPISVHLKINTGMGRFGCSPEQVDSLIMRIRTQKHLVLEGILSHFSEAEVVNSDFSETQLQLFTGIVHRLQNAQVLPRFVHMANSAGIQNIPESHFNLVRPGLSLYQNAMQLVASVLAIHDVSKGESVSYNRLFVASRNCRIAILAAGYADGVPVDLSNKGVVFIHEQACAIVGKVCMDYTLVDITDCATPIHVGDFAEIVGSHEENSLNRIAALSTLNVRPLMCQLGALQRYPVQII